jgi:predicted TIM-barrel fold metal-dependent hydrolase
LSSPFIVDAHLHVGHVSSFFAPLIGQKDLLDTMDNDGISHSICMDHRTVFEGAEAGLEPLRDLFETSGRRVYFLGTFDPRRASGCLNALKQARDWPGFVGLKLHPSIHGVPADAPVYDQAWRFAADHDLAIMSHSWSASRTNPVQILSTPDRFEVHIRKFPQVRFVLGHAGGREAGRQQAVRLANQYPHVHLDFAGDIYDYRLLEKLLESLPAEKILYGSDFPWMDPGSNISRVLLAEIEDSAKSLILRGNAIRTYRLGVS